MMLLLTLWMACVGVICVMSQTPWPVGFFIAAVPSLLAVVRDAQLKRLRKDFNKFLH